MAISKYFESLTTSIKQSVSQRFYHHAKFCATHQVFVIVAAILIVLPLCYPALNVYYLNPTSDFLTFYWELPSSRIPISKSSFQQKCGALPSLHVESIIIKTDGFRAKDSENPQPNDKNILDKRYKRFLSWTRLLQEKLATTEVSYPPNVTPGQKYTLSDLCFKPNEGNKCLVYSPIEFWNYDAGLLEGDKDISNTLSTTDKVSSFKIPIPLESIFGNPVYDKAGKITGADSIMLTYFLEDTGNCAEGQTLAIWDLLWKHVMDANDTCRVGDERVRANMDFKEASNHIVFTFNRKNEFPMEFVLLAFGYLIAFLYISLSLGRLGCVKSKFGLAFSTLAHVFASLVVSLSICSLFGVILTLASWKVLSLILVVFGVENMFILTNAVTSTSMESPVKERVGKGLEKVGVSMTKILFTCLSFFILCSATTSNDLVQEFCIFTPVAMIVDYLLQMSFFITTLSIDLRRLEISDLYNQRVKTPLKSRNLKSINNVRDGIHTSSTNYFYNGTYGRVATYLIIIIFASAIMNIYQTNGDLSSLLSSFKNVFDDSHMNRNTLGNITATKNAFYETSTAVHAEAFWNVVNPKKKNRYFKIRNPRRFTLLWEFDQTKEPTESTEPESSPFVLEVVGAKLSVRSTIKSFIWVLKFIISPAFGIIFATSFLIGCLVPSDQIGKNASNGDKSGKKITLPLPFHKNSLSLMATPRVVTLRGRHSADVSLLCANPSGMIISTATDKHITSWDGKRGVSLRKLERYMRKCDSCKCGDTGGMKTCISWPVRAMCMSEKIELAAAGFEDGVVRVWDINTGQATYILKDTVEDVESIMSAMSEHTKDRVSCLQFVVPTSSSSMPQTPTYEKGYMNFSVTPISAPAMLLAAYRDGYFREWDLVSGQLVHVIATNQKGGISYLCVLDDGELDYNKNDLYIYTGARDGSIKCWVRSIYYSESEPNITSSTDPSEFRKSRWKSIYTIASETGSAITCIAAKIVKTANSAYGIVIAGAADGEVKVYDYLTGKPITSLSQGVTFKQRREKEKEERLLQKKLQRKLLIQQQKVKRQQFLSLKNNLRNNSNHKLSLDPDWYDDDFDDDDFDDDDYDETEDTDDDDSLKSHQEAITNIIINPLEQESCPCGNTEYGGFSIVTSSVDEKVHVWQLVRNVMDCTCISLRIENSSSSSKNNVTPAQWDGVISYNPKFIGRVNQPGGTAIVFIRENVVGVRKVKHSLASKNGTPRCHGAEGEWEMWMLEINDPKVIETVQKDLESSDNEIDVAELSVQTIPLVSEADIFTEEQQKKKKVFKRRNKESTGELKGFVRRRRNIFNTNNVVGSSFGPTFPLPSNISNNNDHDHSHHHHDHHHEEDIQSMQGQVVDFRQKSRRRGSVLQRIYPNHRQLSLLDEEDEMNEFLPFAHVRQVVKIGDGGVAVAYGNFVKVVLFEESNYNYGIGDR